MAVAVRRSLLVLTLFALPAFLILIGLGVWQVQRLHWKEALLGQIEARRDAVPIAISDGVKQARLRGDVDYLPVEGEAARLPGAPLQLYWIENGTPGWRLYAPYAVADGTLIIVDRGFVPDKVETAPDAVTGLVHLRGRLRLPERPGYFTPENDAARNAWYWRDLDGMAAALRLDKNRLSPAFLVLEGNAADATWPRASTLPPELSNRHLGYAITWFGLALCLAGVYAAYVYKNMGAGE